MSKRDRNRGGTNKTKARRGEKGQKHTFVSCLDGSTDHGTFLSDDTTFLCCSFTGTNRPDQLLEFHRHFGSTSLTRPGSVRRRKKRVKDCRKGEEGRQMRPPVRESPHKKHRRADCNGGDKGLGAARTRERGRDRPNPTNMTTSALEPEQHHSEVGECFTTLRVPN